MDEQKEKTEDNDAEQSSLKPPPLAKKASKAGDAKAKAPEGIGMTILEGNIKASAVEVIQAAKSQAEPEPPKVPEEPDHAEPAKSAELAAVHPPTMTPEPKESPVAALPETSKIPPAPKVPQPLKPLKVSDEANAQAPKGLGRTILDGMLKGDLAKLITGDQSPQASAPAGLGQTILEGMLKPAKVATTFFEEVFGGRKGDTADAPVAEAGVEAPPGTAKAGPKWCEVDPGLEFELDFNTCAADALPPEFDRELFEMYSTVGIVVDRTVSPEQVLGVGCITDKNRFSLPASAVFNYAKAPWALAVRFPVPSPNPTFGVKMITLHPDFNTRYARMHYLGQTGAPGDSPPVAPHNIAQLMLDPNLPVFNQPNVSELDLSLKMPIPDVAISGEVEGTGIASVIDNMLARGTPGTLRFLDARNLPVAYVLISKAGQCSVKKAFFGGLSRHFAIFELLYRKPATKYYFLPGGEFPVSGARDIESGASELIAEARRRAPEVPLLFAQLGGPEARYERLVDQYDSAQIHPTNRWIVERVWNVLDGHLTLDQLWQRSGADTHVSLRAVNILRRMKLIALREEGSRKTVDKVGLPLIHQRMDSLTAGDQLTGLYIDPLTMRLFKVTGDFLGKSEEDDPYAYKHSVRFPRSLQGAVLLKDKNLVGFNVGVHLAAEGQEESPVYEMISAESLRELKSRKQLTAATREIEGVDDSQRTTGQRAKLISAIPMPEPEIPLEKGPIISKRRLITIGLPILIFAGMFGTLAYYMSNPQSIPSFLRFGQTTAVGSSAKTEEDDGSASSSAKEEAAPTAPSGPRHKVASGELDKFGAEVDSFLHRTYKPGKWFKKPEDKVVVRLYISSSGIASGFIVREPSRDLKFNTYILHWLSSRTWPAAPHITAGDVPVDFTIDGAKSHAAIGK